MKHLGSIVSRHPLTSNFKQVDRKIELVENTYNNSLLEKSSPDEVVQARGKFASLGARLQHTQGFSHQLYTLKNARITHDDQSDTYKFLCEKVVAKINDNTVEFINIDVDILNPDISEELLATKSDFSPESLGAVSFLVSLGDDGVYIDRAVFVEQEKDELFNGNDFSNDLQDTPESPTFKKPHVPTSEDTQDNLFLAIGVMNIGDIYKAETQADSDASVAGEMVGVMRESDFFIAQPNVFSYGTLVNKSQYFLHFKHAIRHCQQNSLSFHYSNLVDVLPCAFLHEEIRQITDLKNTVINAGHMLFGSNADKNVDVQSADIADINELDNLFARLTNVTINDLRVGFVLAYAVTDLKLNVSSFKPPIELEGVSGASFKDLPVISLQDADSRQSSGTVRCETLLPVKMMLVKDTDAYRRVDNAKDSLAVLGHIYDKKAASVPFKRGSYTIPLTPPGSLTGTVHNYWTYNLMHESLMRSAKTISKVTLTLIRSIRRDGVWQDFFTATMDFEPKEYGQSIHSLYSSLTDRRSVEISFNYKVVERSEFRNNQLTTFTSPVKMYYGFNIMNYDLGLAQGNKFRIDDCSITLTDI